MSTPDTDLAIGTPVLVRRDDGTLLDTVTRSEPWQLGGGTWVVAVQGIAGGYALSRVTPHARVTAAIDSRPRGEALIGDNGKGQVLIDFQSYLRWVQFTPAEAEDFAATILQRARSLATVSQP